MSCDVALTIEEFDRFNESNLQFLACVSSLSFFICDQLRAVQIIVTGDMWTVCNDWLNKIVNFQRRNLTLMEVGSGKGGGNR